MQGKRPRGVRVRRLRRPYHHSRLKEKGDDAPAAVWFCPNKGPLPPLSVVSPTDSQGRFLGNVFGGHPAQHNSGSTSS